MAVIDFLAGKLGGVLISLGLLITASWWAVNTYVRKLDGAEGKRDIKVARILMYVFLCLTLIRVFLGPKIAELAMKRLVKMETGAKSMLSLAAAAKTDVGMQLIKSRKALSNKYVSGALTLGIIGSVFLLETGDKEGDEARQMPVALALVAVAIVAFYGQVVKDSAASAIAKVSAIAKPVTA